MHRKILIIVLCVSVALSFTTIGWSDDDDEIEFQCCCYVKCCYKYKYETDAGTWVWAEWWGDFSENPQCNKSDIFMEQFCESDLKATWVCIEGANKIRSMLFFPVRNFHYDRHTGECVLEAECSSEDLLGFDDPRLDILRKFRDEVLEKSEKAKKLVDVYYRYGAVLIDAFDENPGIGECATEVLEKTITRLYEALGSEEELLTDEIATDIEILIDELDTVVASPELKKTMKQIKRDIGNGTLLK